MFEEKAIAYLEARDVVISKTEGAGTNSLVFHIRPEDIEKINSFKGEMEVELDANVEPTDMFGFFVVMVESKDLSEDNDDED